MGFAGFETFVSEQRMSLLRSAYLLTGDRQRAEDHVRHALTELAEHWTQVGPPNPEAFVRVALYRDVAATRREVPALTVQRFCDQLRNLDPPETLAIDAWAAGQRRRRRRSRARVGLAMAATVAVCGALIVVSAHERDVHLPLAPPTTSAAAKRVDHVLPSSLADLPLLHTDFPERIDPSQGVPLAQHPVRRALALFQGLGSILVLGDDGELRTLGDWPMSETALSADGRTAVFPQRDGVLVVDLTTGSSRTVPVPGDNRHASISPDGTQLVASSPDRGTSLVHVPDGELIISTPTEQLPLVFSSTESVAYGLVNADGKAVLKRWGFRWPEKTGSNGSMAYDMGVSGVRGTPVTRGDLIAWAGVGGYDHLSVIGLSQYSWTPNQPRRPPVLGVRTGGVRPARWLDDSTLLLVCDGPRPMVVAWNIDTGSFHRVMEVERPGLLAM
ncbi:hypothetical protein Lesp02_37220 [Lentzea sp. NBRC 105346]|uniref:hypothetical protein n=1 Tax=Lentzea sp. NBRC 105346 TaxID=3032205 RepID=UPI0024A10F31|nr:hypothetical protein [Lentzea sp. NBRC 105346]GLZ31534.1 hypothetical protein Lesp02_37220 [Lentzea sp. NBRC 105346]